MFRLRLLVCLRQQADKLNMTVTPLNMTLTSPACLHRQTCMLEATSRHVQQVIDYIQYDHSLIGFGLTGCQITC